jgi:hypothetical protein
MVRFFLIKGLARRRSSTPVLGLGRSSALGFAAFPVKRWRIRRSGLGEGQFTAEGFGQDTLSQLVHSKRISRTADA